MKCDECFKRKTILCPSSIECFSKKDKPYFMNDSKIDTIKYIVKLQQELDKANKVIDDIEEYIDSQNSDMTNDLDFIGSTLTLNEEYVILNLFRRLKDKIK